MPSENTEEWYRKRLSSSRWDAYICGILIGYVVKDTVAEPTAFHILVAAAVFLVGVALFCRQVKA